MFGDAFNGGMVCILKGAGRTPGKFCFSGFERNDAVTLAELFADGMPDDSAGNSSDGNGWVGIWTDVPLWATGSNGGARRDLHTVVMRESVDGFVECVALYSNSDTGWKSWELIWEPSYSYDSEPAYV